MAPQHLVHILAPSHEPRRRVRVALVMPVRNEKANVRSTLDAMFSSSRLPDEIIIADGMSSDETVAEIMRYADRGIPLRVLPNPARYSGGGRNVGIRGSNCEIILLADFGNVVDADWAEQMIRPFEERDDIDIVAGPHRPLVRSAFEHCMASIQYYDEYSMKQFTSAQKIAQLPAVFTPGSASLAVTRRMWEICAGYPEWLHRAQDKLFTRKARQLGARFAIAWCAHISHHMRGSSREVFMQFFSYGRGNGQSRYLDPRFLKLGAFYGMLSLLCGFALAGPQTPVLVTGIYLAYCYRYGLRKVIAIDGGLKQARYLRLVIQVLLARDLGSLAGHVVGWTEWLLVPTFRRRFNAYMRPGP